MQEIPRDSRGAAPGPLTRYRALVAAGELHGDTAQVRAAEKLDALMQALEARTGLFGRKRAPCGLYLFGEVGRGKSMLMDLFHECTRFAPKRRVHFHDFMLDVHSRVKQARATREGDPLSAVAHCIADETRLICLDEFQVEDIADAMILGRLFEALFAQGVCVVATSNTAPDALYENGINRQLFLPFIALLKKNMEAHHLDGPMDHRLAKMKGFTLYLFPLGATTDTALERAWKSLTGGAAHERLSLNVQGHTLDVPMQARGAARFTFAELCEQPLGAADYLALARRFHTLVLSHVPKLEAGRNDTAMRFITLIDALYENKVKLVCSADALPQELYPSGEESFAFKRAASRLVEMQGDEYLRARHKAR